MPSRRVNLFLLLSGSTLILVAALGLWWFRMMSRVHQHCIKVAGTAFMNYSMDHSGRLPYDTNGFGNAMLLLVKEGQLPGVAWICGPGDDGHVLSNALVRGVHVPEADCSRIYVQGLSEKNDPNICILFDRRSVPGGDHFYGRGKPLREALLLDGSMQTVPDAQWPDFCRRQVELLVAAGFPRQKALKYYPEASVSK